MIKSFHAKLLSFAFILFLGITTTGCLINNSLGNFKETGAGQQVIFAFGGTLLVCSEESGDASDSFEVLCEFVIENASAESFLQIFNLPIPVLIFIDPIIAQLPAEATNITGTFNGAGQSGALDIQAGFTTLPADINSNIVAEPGMQLVVFDFPDRPLFNNDFTFNISYDIPGGVDPVQIKTMAAGKILTEEGTFYPPIFPCKDDFADIPSFDVPESDTLQPLDLSVYASEPGCEGRIYDYEGLTPIIVGRPIPTISEWGLIAMAGIFGLMAIWAITRRRVAE